MTLKLTRLPQTEPDWPAMQVWWQQVVEAIEAQETTQDEQIAAIQAAQDAADAANAAAAAANTAADTVTASSDLANSFISNFTPPMVSADSAGNVTIANHDRTYGDGTSVPVTGALVATGEVNPAYVYLFYDDPTRAGGIVTYQFSTVESDAAQIGDRHSVGAVQIPAAGTNDGGYARPPGYGGFEP